MNKWRNPDGQYVKRRSAAYIAGIWLASLVSLGLLLGIGFWLRADFAAFKSCSSNNDVIAVSSCGKQSLNVGDFVLIGLFVLAAALTVTLFTGAIRTVRRRA